MSQDDSGYFFILVQIETDLVIDHEDLLRSTRSGLGKALELWFIQRAVETNTAPRTITEELKNSVFRVKEELREAEEG